MPNKVKSRWIDYSDIPLACNTQEELSNFQISMYMIK